MPQLIKFIKTHDTINWGLIIGLDLLFFLILIYIILKQLIPAIKGKPALEINSKGIISYVKNIEIDWQDINEIKLISGQSSSAIDIKFKSETDQGDHIRIGLGFITGNDKEIYNTMVLQLKEVNE